MITELTRQAIPYAIRRESKAYWLVLNRNYEPIHPKEEIRLSKKKVDFLLANASSGSASNGCSYEDVHIIHLYDSLTFFAAHGRPRGAELHFQKFARCLEVILTAKTRTTE